MCSLSNIQTLSRYYSNTFSDTEKQHSMNIFLGYFNPSDNKGKQCIKLPENTILQNFMHIFFRPFLLENIPIWDLPTDYFMHNPQREIEKQLLSVRPLTEWVSPFILNHLPCSTSDSNKKVDELIRVHTRGLEMIDYYSSYHIPYKRTSFEENIAYNISLMARCFTPKFRTNFSPFEPATRRTEDRGILKNPSLTGQSSTGSTNSDSSSDDESSSEDDSLLESSITQNISGGTDELEPMESSTKCITYDKMLLPLNGIYHMELKEPNTDDMEKYKLYAKMRKILMSNAAMSTYNPKKPLLNRHKRVINLEPLGNYGYDCYKRVQPPKVTDASIEIYEKYIDSPAKVHTGAPSVNDLDTIHKYLALADVVSMSSSSHT